MLHLQLITSLWTQSRAYPKLANSFLKHPPFDPYLPYSRDDAVETLRVAIGVFDWFGENGPFVAFETLIPLWR